MTAQDAAATALDIDHTAVDSLVDFDLAVRIATGLMRPGPRLPRDEIAAVVAQLRQFAIDSTGHVHQVTGLTATPGAGVLVVDRPGWVKANADGFRTMLAPAVTRALQSRPRPQSPTVLAVGRKATAAEVGSLLAFMGTRVLGQYDIAGSGPTDSPTAPGGGGRLLLVAPTIVHVERELGVTPRDFRLWVCLHEETHRVQFSACPWLRPYLLGSIRELVVDLLGNPGELVDRVTTAVRVLPDLVRGGSGTSLLDVIQTPQQKEQLARLTAVMSLLEGHADVVMDAVGPSVIPTVATIRDRFTRRRQGAGALDKLLRRLLGLEAKMRQYRDGAAFVRGVVDRVGMDGFNQVWTSPDTLPLPLEISDPQAWLRRVHG